MFTLFQDIRFGARLLLKDRSFTITALLTLAICIGANAAMFSVVRSVLLKPLPFPDSERVVLLYNSYPNAGAPRVGAAVPDYFDRHDGRDRRSTKQALFRREGMTLRRRERRRAPDHRFAPRRRSSASCTSSRSWAACSPTTKARSGKNQKVLLSYAFWQRKFGGAPSIDRPEDSAERQPSSTSSACCRPSSRSCRTTSTSFVPAAFAPAEKGDDRRHSNNWQMIGRLRGRRDDRSGAAAGRRAQRRERRSVSGVSADSEGRALSHRHGLPAATTWCATCKHVLYLLWGGVAVRARASAASTSRTS